MRIELTLSAWKAEVLPLNYIRKRWSGRRDSNSRPSPWQGDALPLSHFRTLVEGDGFEPSKAVLTDLLSAPFGRSGTPRKISYVIDKVYYYLFFRKLQALNSILASSLKSLELMEGIEPPTYWLQISCSTVEPHQHEVMWCSSTGIGDRERARTVDLQRDRLAF